MLETLIPPVTSGYLRVNDLHMYYETYGRGKPLVLIHGGGSTIQTTFGNIIPFFAGSRLVIAMDMQAHGRTGDRHADLSFKQDADDIAAVLDQLEIAKADFMGFSNGGQTLIELALRHPGIIGKLVIASALYKRSAASPQFWDGFDLATLEMMPRALKDEFLKVNNDEAALLNMFSKDVKRMKHFEGWTDEEIRSIAAPVLIMNGNHDVGSAEHAVEMFRNFPNAQLVILPGTHGDYIGTMETVNGKWKQQYTADIIMQFLDS